MVLKYLWLGDDSAEDGNSATITYATGGTCAAPTGVTTLATHELDDGTDGGSAWSSEQSINLPGGLNGTSFFLRVVNADQDNSNEDFRVDGVSLTGIPN